MGYEALVSDEVLSPMVQKIALAIQDQAALLCPVDTGDLRASISVSMQGFYKAVESTDEQISTPPDPKEAYVGSAKAHAAAVEHGRPDLPGYPAQPYLRPARDQVNAQMGRIGGEELKKNMEAYANRYPHKVKVMEGKQ